MHFAAVSAKLLKALVVRVDEEEVWRWRRCRACVHADRVVRRACSVSPHRIAGRREAAPFGREVGDKAAPAATLAPLLARGEVGREAGSKGRGTAVATVLSSRLNARV